MSYQKHRFFKKENGYWLVYCPIHRISFSTKDWSNGICERQTCPHCHHNVSEMVLVPIHAKKESKYVKEANKNHKLARWGFESVWNVK